MKSKQPNPSAGSTPAATLEPDYTLVECDLESLEELVIGLERSHTISLRNQPSVCLTMIPAEDSLEGQRFYLGEALVTECEVDVNGKTGFGLCLGDEPRRAYCLAVVDALIGSGRQAPAEIEVFLERESKIVRRREQDELELVLQTRVDFKLMEEE